MRHTWWCVKKGCMWLALLLFRFGIKILDQLLYTLFYFIRVQCNCNSSFLLLRSLINFIKSYSFSFPFISKYVQSTKTASALRHNRLKPKLHFTSNLNKKKSIFTPVIAAMSMVLWWLTWLIVLMLIKEWER